MTTRPGSGPGRRWLARASLGAGAFLVACLAAEIAYRALLVGGQGPTTNPRIVQHDPRLGWSHRPNSQARHRTSEFDVSIAIDADGRRAAAGGEGPVGGPLVLCLGDSFTFGWGVEEAQTFPARLRERLQARVLNLGVSGYGTDQQYLQLVGDGLREGPQLVIVTHSSNDFEEVLRDFCYGKSKPRFADRGNGLELTNSPVPQIWLERESVLYATARRHLVDWLRPELREAEHAAGRSIVRILYRRMADELRKLGANLLVVAWSTDDLVAPDSGPTVLDIGPALAAVPGATTFPLDGHWTALGHAVVADAIAGHVEALELLSR